MEENSGLGGGARNQAGQGERRGGEPDLIPAGDGATALPTPLRVVDTLFGALVTALLAALVGVVGLNIGGRFLFNYSIPWADELSRFLFIWLIFVGAALAYFRGEHILVSFLTERLPSKAALSLRLFQNLLVLGILVVFGWGSWQLMTSSLAPSALLGIPFSWVAFSVLLSVTLMGIACLYQLFSGLALLVKGGE
jgi:TRAP-type transport system small permease protein